MIPSEWLVAVASGDSDRETERLVLAAVLADPALRRRFELLRDEVLDLSGGTTGTSPSAELMQRALESVREIAGGGGRELPQEKQGESLPSNDSIRTRSPRRARRHRSP